MSDANWRKQERLSVNKTEFRNRASTELHWSLVIQGVED